MDSRADLVPFPPELVRQVALLQGEVAGLVKGYLLREGIGQDVRVDLGAMGYRVVPAPAAEPSRA